jgi:hypothetical protein
VALHRSRWPDDLSGYEVALGRLLARVMAGEAVVTLCDGRRGSEGPVRVQLCGLDPADRKEFSRLPVPEVEDDRGPAGALDLAAIRLPEILRQEPRWSISAAGFRNYAEFDSLDAVICQRLLAPILGDLAYVLRLRAGDGPKTKKGRLVRMERCREAHAALGFGADPLTVLLNPDLSADAVVAARAALVGSWAECPVDLGERALALLCGRLAKAYYSKARKDGTVEAARVLTSDSAGLLEATLGGWPTLVTYLGEVQAIADAEPIDTPRVKLPPDPPPEIDERVLVLREWWEMYDARHAAQHAGMEALSDLVPTRWDYSLPNENEGQRRRGLDRRAIDPDLIARIEALWGWQVLDRQPDTLVCDLRPLGVLAELLEPAAVFWNELALTAWFLCFGPYSRRTLDQLEGHQAEVRRELAELGAPIEPAIYEELMALAVEHVFLVEQASFSLGISIGIGFDGEGQPTVESTVPEPEQRSHPAVFDALRDIITKHRRTWLEQELPRLLDRLWRRDLEAAAEAYWRRYRGRGKAPTVKQALPDVQAAARRWFGADHGALARFLGLDGPITGSPVMSPRALPHDLAELQHEVAQRLTAEAPTPDGGVDRSYNLERLALQARTVLTVWQATGAVPPRSGVFGTGLRWTVEQTLGCDLDDGYRLLLAAVRDALERRGHPAAASMVVE